MANTYERWATSVLTRLGVHPNRENLRALVGWAKAEGGHFHNQARYNVLNTTQPEPGAGNTGSQGNIKVYRSWDQGVQATVETLQNGRYGGIIRALKRGSADDVAYAIGASPWGTSADLVRRTIGSTGAVRPSGKGLVSGGASPAGGTQSYATTGAVDNSSERQQLKLSYLHDRGRPDALLNLAMGLRGAQDVPGQRVPVGATDASQGGSQTVNVKRATGTASFEGKTVAAWIKPALVYARKHGWKGQVNSGYRSFEEQTRIYNSGVRPAARPGHSNHEGSDFPRGAVDVSDAESLSRILRASPWARKLIYAGPKDPVHFSHPHGGSY